MRILIAVSLVLGLAVAISAVDNQPQPEKSSRKENAVLKTVVHINFADSERQEYGLKNLENILREEGSKTEIEVVCHGAGISLLVKDKSSHADQVAALIKQGVRFVACENTMKQKQIVSDKLLSGVTTVPSGAVEIIRKQSEGYGYFKP